MSEEIILASTALASRLGVEKTHMLETIKGQCFPNMRADQVSDTQLAAFVQIAQSLNLNPLLPGMLYSYPGKNGGIIPMIGPDGVFTLLASSPEIAGWTTTHGQTEDKEPFATAVIKHKRLGEISYTAFLSEWRVQSNPNWGSRPRHMLGIRALKHAARQIIHGIPFDPEEREIIDLQDSGETTKAAPTPAELAAKRAALPPKAKGAAAMKSVGGSSTAEAPTSTPGNAVNGQPPSAPAEQQTPPPSAPTAETKPPVAPNPPENELPAAGASGAAKAEEAEEAEEADPTPPHPQPEGWPLVIEAAVLEAKEIGMTIPGAKPGEQLKAKTIRCVLGGPEASKLQALTGATNAMINPYDLKALEGKAKASPAVARFTIQSWESVKTPGTYVPVIMAVDDIETC